MIAEVIINSNVKKLNKTFDYKVPKQEENNIQIGSRVFVPFGRSKTWEEGFVIGFKDISNFPTKEIAKIQEQSLTEKQIYLAKWMANRYFCNVSDCIKLMLIPGTATKQMEKRTKEKNIQAVYLKLDKEEIERQIEQKGLKSEKQIKVLKFLMDNEGATIAEIEMFTDATRAIVKTLEKNGYLEIVEKQVQRNPFLSKQIQRTESLKLNKQQEVAYQIIEEKINQRKYESFLIYGVTGSGKTEIYLQLIEKVLNQGKTAMMLVPEIALTPQMVNRFIGRFGEESIAVLHSKLSIGERYDSWQKIQKGEAKIVIGARSAVFAPISSLGIIIMDEEHDSSYKSDMSPRYQTKEIATYLAKQQQIPFVLGSATPDINTFYKANQGEITLLKLSKRANESNLPEVKIVDLRKELANGNRTMFSLELYQAIEDNLKNQKQTILFLNRRGFSTFVMCRDCGYTVKCKNCNISLTYHKKTKKLKCHYCGYEQELVKICPECGSEKIRYFGTGTQKVEEQIHKYFPQASTIRMDVDTVTKKNSHEEILNDFKEKNIDILIGTQMVVKGHHFPKVTLVGVIAADSSLNMQDYRAQERTFDLLVQVAGRAGRDKLPGKVIIQTYNPDDFSIQTSQKQDYDLFYNSEIKLRKQLNYPPFCDIILFGISSHKEKEVKEVAEKIHFLLQKEFTNKQILANLLKPIPAPIDKIKNRYRWRLIIKGPLTDDMIQSIHICLEEYYRNNQYKEVRVIVDVNPTNMM